MCVGNVLGDGPALFVLESSPRSLAFLVSSGKLERLCASRRLLGLRGVCWRTLELRIEGSREGPDPGGDDGLREDIEGFVLSTLILHRI